MNRSCGYVRVSTVGQATDGCSLSMQEAKIRAYASFYELDLVDIIVDAGLSGKNLTGRPGAQKMLELVRTKKVDAIIIYSLSRLGRSTIDLLETAELLKKHKVSLHSITENLNTETALGSFFFTLISALAEMERKIISERTSSALQSMKSKGEKVSSRPPYGYCYVDGFEVPVLQEQACIEHLTALRASTPGLGMKKAAKLLESAGYVNRNGIRFGVSSMRVLWKLTGRVSLMKEAA